MKSWMVDKLLSVARETYTEIEKELGCSVYKEQIIYRALKDIKAENQWDERSATDGYAPFMGEESPAKEVQTLLEKPFSWGAVHGAGQVDLPTLLTALKKFFISRKALRNEDFDYDALELKLSGEAQYKNVSAKQVVFCEGHRGRFNPWFGHLPFVVSKGEMLEIAMEKTVDFPIVKHRAYLAPLADNKLWVGATYEWKDLSEGVSEKGKTLLIKNIDASISGKYRIVAEHAAIRPTVKDRRPFLGTDSKYSCLHIFNGLGTKGTSLGPYWGRHFVGYLLGEHGLDEQVDIGRFL